METNFHILVANEPSTYRQLLATELPSLRPRFRVLSVDPDGLDAAIAQFHPRLVICSRMTETVRSQVLAAIVLYPDGDDYAFIEIGRQHSKLSSPRLADLLAAIDSTMDPLRTRA